MQRADAHAGAPFEQRREHVEPARAREVHDERAGLDRRLGGRAAPVRSRGRAWRRARARRRARPSDTSAGGDARHAAADGGRRRVGRAARDADDGPTLFDQAERDRRPRATRSDQGDGALLFRHGMRNVTAASRTPSHAAAGVDQRGRDVAQRRQHEPALPHPRVRHREIGIVEPQVVVQQDVDVERARAPALDRARAARRARSAARARAARAGRASVSIATTAFRYASCGGPPTGAVS